MRRIHALIPYLVAFLLIVTIFLLGCGGQELVSTWCDREVAIDGMDAEWHQAMVYIDEENVALGLLNDESYLYLCLATVDSRVVRQMIGAGFTIWFDPKGGKEKGFGINFPLGMEFSQQDWDRGDIPLPAPGEDVQDPEKLRTMLETSAKEMVILGPGENERRMMPASGSQEVKVKLGYAGGKLVYELRVPLVRDGDHPDAIGLRDGRYVGVGFETAEMDREAMKEEMRNRMGTGGPPTGGGKRGGGMPGGGMRGGGMPGGRGPSGEMPERLELWTKVQLASAENAATL